MPIFIHKKTTLYKNIYRYTKTITINRESYQFSLTYNVRSSINANHYLKEEFGFSKITTWN